jgi:hypothetical protein
MKAAPHTRIVKDAHDKALTALGTQGLAVYVALCRIQSDARAEEKSLFAAGAQRIARHCGLSVRCIRYYLPKLAVLGLISIKSGRNAGRKSDHEENRISLLGSAALAQAPYAPDAQAPYAPKAEAWCSRIKKEKGIGQNKEARKGALPRV